MVRDFIKAFASQCIHAPPNKYVGVLLASFESLQTIMEAVRK